MKLSYQALQAFVYGEARALDEHRWLDWLAYYASDVEFFMPSWDDDDKLTTDPHNEVSLIYYPSRQGLEDRVFRIQTDRSSATTPDTRTGHAINNLEVLEQDDQRSRSFHVAEKAVAEALAFAGALDQPRDVGHHELHVVPAHHAQVRLQRGERIVGDLWCGRRDDGDQRALARVGKTDEGDVGHQLELEVEPALLAGFTLLGEARRPSPVRQEPGVAAAALAAGIGTREPLGSFRCRGSSVREAPLDSGVSPVRGHGWRPRCWMADPARVAGQRADRCW